MMAWPSGLRYVFLVLLAAVVCLLVWRSTRDA